MSASLFSRARTGSRHMLYSVVAIAVVVSASWAARKWYLFQLDDNRGNAARELRSVSHLVVDGLQQWRRERLGDGWAIARDPSLANDVRALLNGNRAAAETRVLERLRAFQAFGQYHEVMVVDAGGIVQLRDPAGSQPLWPEVLARIAPSMRSGRPEIVDFFLDASAGNAYLALIVPVGPGVIVFRIDPNDFVHPLIEAWPGQSQTSENILLRRDDNEAQFLNDLRFDPHAVMRRCISLDRHEVLAVKAVLGTRGLADGIDYAGQPSLGVLAEIPDSPWLLVSRIEMSEIHAATRQSLWPIVLSVALIVVTAATGLFAIATSEKAQFREKETALVAASEHAASVLQDVLKTSPTVVYQMREEAGQLVPTEVSENVERLTGYTVAEALAPGWWSRAVVGEDLPAAMAQVATLATENSISHEFRLRVKDGPVLWIQDQVRVARRDNGRPVELSGSWSDVTVRREAEERLRESEHSLRRSLGEREALLKEVHHRVKNNLQVINSLMRLEAGRNGDLAVKSVLGDMQSRILSMALLHETLYRGGNFAQIDLARYLTQLTNQVFRSTAHAGLRVRLEPEMAPALVNLEQAVPCGLLLNELLSNALKHGFPDLRDGTIRVSLTTTATDVVLEVADTGVGLPDDWEARRQNSLGLQLVSDLTRQLRGTLTVMRAPGARFTLRFTPQAKEDPA